MRTLKSLSLHLTLLAFVAGPLLAACGDNIKAGGDIDGGGDDDPDPDADTSVDADGSPTRGATIAVFDTKLIDPQAALVQGVSGGAIRTSFLDLSMNGGLEVYRENATSPIQSCLVTKYDATHLPNPRVDAGEITLSAPETGASALLKTVGPCTLQSPFGDPDPYICLSHEATGATVGAMDLNGQPGLANSGAVAYTLALPAVDFGMRTPVAITSATRNAGGTAVTVVTATPHGFLPAQFVTIAGVTPANFNTTTGAPIVAVPSPTTFVYGQGGTGSDAATAFGTAAVPTYAIVGSTLSINGLTDPTFNSGASAFPIVNQLSANTLVVINSAPANDAMQAPVATGAYKILNGFSPIPGGNSGLADFLGGSPAPGTTSSIRIQKPADPDWPAIDFTVDIPGQARVPVALTSVARASDVVTATTTVTHDFIVGQVLTIAGVPEVQADVTSATQLVNAVTVVAPDHGFAVGDTFTLAGNAQATLNGNHTVATVSDADTFTFELVGTVGLGLGGTVTLTSFNGQHTVVATPTDTTFTYAQVASDRTAAGGTAVKPGGFELDATSALPQAFPTVAAAQLYSCGNNTDTLADDTCGDETAGGPGVIKGFIISGSATKKSVAGLFPFQMPTEVPGTDEWLEWQCAYILGHSGEMPIGAVEAILDFEPTRIEQQLLFVAGTLLDGPGTNNAGTGRVLAGHAVAGHTTFCPDAGAIPAATITAISRADDVVTVTTSGKHNFFPTQVVTIAGVTDTEFNGEFTITSTPTANGASTSFTFAQVDDDATSTGGTATVPTALSGFGPVAGPICPP